ncbi:MAG: DUF3825 domain-containing protein [Erysipelotrichales bacterium]|nr:DUF3825 domain-containing protein [Erysipelotrichales bacterium]
MLHALEREYEFEEGKKLTDFAFCGTKDDFHAKIKFLANMAESETWSFEGRTNSILTKYINTAFRQCYREKKIMYSDNNEYACFNTGLLTPHGHDIIAWFAVNLNTDAQEKWFFKGFKDKSDKHFMNMFSLVPELATYTDNFADYYFNPELNIEINSNHILEENWDNIKDILKLDKAIVKTLLFGVLEEAKKKIKRNFRLVVPQFYNEVIMYLLPIEFPIGNNQTETLALAVQKIDNQYRANTIFTLDVAYEKARLLMKPESSWLSEKNVKIFLNR